MGVVLLRFIFVMKIEVIGECSALKVFQQITSSLKQSTFGKRYLCLLYTSPSPRDRTRSRMPSSA